MNTETLYQQSQKHQERIWPHPWSPYPAFYAQPLKSSQFKEKNQQFSYYPKHIPSISEFDDQVGQLTVSINNVCKLDLALNSEYEGILKKAITKNKRRTQPSIDAIRGSGINRSSNINCSKQHRRRKKNPNCKKL